MPNEAIWLILDTWIDFHEVRQRLVRHKRVPDNVEISWLVQLNLQIKRISLTKMKLLPPLIRLD